MQRLQVTFEAILEVHDPSAYGVENAAIVAQTLASQYNHGEISAEEILALCGSAEISISVNDAD